MVSRSVQASWNSAALGLRSSMVNSLPDDGDGCVASLAAANSRTSVAGIGLVPGAIDPERSLVFCLFRSSKAGSGTGRNHCFVGRHRGDRHAIRGILTPGILVDDALRRLGPLCFLPELRNMAPE